MSKLSKNSPEMLEKPDDLTLEECQEAFAMFRIQRKVQQSMELIMKNPGFWDIRDQIFGYLNYETVENCRKVSKLWNESLERMALVKILIEFGDIVVEGREEKEMSAFFSEWNKAAKRYAAKSSIEDLQEIKDSLLKLLVENGKCCEYPVHRTAEYGNLRLLEFFFKHFI